MVTVGDLYVVVLSHETKWAIGPFSKNTDQNHPPVGPDPFMVFTERRARATAEEWDKMYGTETKKAVVMTLADFLAQ